MTELAPPNLPTSFFDRGSGLEASSERLSSLVVEGLVIDTSERGATAESLWAGGNATRVRLRPLHVALRVDERVQNLSEREKRTTRSAMKDVEGTLTADGSADSHVVPRGDTSGYYYSSVNVGRLNGQRAQWEAWYEVRTEHAVYAMQLPDRTHAEWFAAGDGARLMAVAGAANAAAEAAPNEAYISYIERLLSSRVRECDLFGNARGLFARI